MYQRTSGRQRAAPKQRPITTWEKVPVTFGIDMAALLFGISRSTVLRRCRDGEIPAHKFGKFWTFNKIEIMKYLGVKENPQ